MHPHSRLVIQEEHGWLVLTEGSLVVAVRFWLGWQSLKAWLGLEDVLPRWLPHRCDTSTRCLNSSPCGPLQGAALVSSRWRFPQSEWPKRSGGRSLPFTILRVTYIVTFDSAGHTGLVWNHCERDQLNGASTRQCGSLVAFWGPFWRLLMAISLNANILCSLYD